MSRWRPAAAACTRSCGWGWGSLRPAPPAGCRRRRSPRRGRAFPLRSLRFLHRRLILSLFPRCGDNPGRWRGHTLKAIDKVTLGLPDWPALFRAFGSRHEPPRLGPVSVELCCVFAVLPRIPLAWVFGKAGAHEHHLFRRLLDRLRKRDLLLLDNGFYSFRLFAMIIGRKGNFVIPMARNTRPKVVARLGGHDYLVEIRDSKAPSARPLRLRLVYVYRRGFRRRRLLTSLLDPTRHPADELAALYHLRWDIETFYRDFKDTMQARTWHCQTPDSFAKELAMHMIVVVLVRRAMLAAAASRGVQPARISFARALTEARLLLRRISSCLPEEIRDACREMVAECARYVIAVRPGRQYPRDRQVYRAKARGMRQRRRGRPAKPKPQDPPENSRPETFTCCNGVTYALS